MLYILFSPQPRMIKSALATLLKQQYPSSDEMNVVDFDMAVTTLREIAQECSMLPLGYDKKAIIAENCDFLARRQTKYKFLKDDKPEALLGYLNHPDEAVDLFLLVYSASLDSKNEMVEAVKKNGSIKEVKEFSKQEWLTYIKRYFERREIAIDNQAIAELYRRTGGDFAAFLNEAQKVSTYAAGSRVDSAMVASLVSEPLEDNAFAMSNALCKGDNALALRIYKDLCAHSVEPISLVNMLSSQFRFLNEVRFLSGSGADGGGIAKTLAASPIRVQIAQDTLRRIRGDQLNSILDDIYLLDYAILSGQQDADFAFQRFLANFSL